jgi:hypothetical protein
MTGHKNVIARDFSPFHFRTSAHLYESIGATSERVLASRSGSAWRDVEIQGNQIERVPSGRRVVAMFFGTTPSRPSRVFEIGQHSKNFRSRHILLQRNAREESMKFSSPSLRRTKTLATCLVAFASFAGACSSDTTTTPPNNPPDASDPGPMPDVYVPPPPPPDMDAGTVVCGSNTCASRFVGGQLGLACCAGGGMRCGLTFGQGCVDQSDAGNTPPMFDAATVVPDPSCGTVSIDFNGMPFTLPGCCLPSAMCGYYVAQMPSIGCLTIDQLRGQGAAVPDAPIPCSADGGPLP